MLEDLLNQIDQKKEELRNLRPIKAEYLSRIRDKFKLEYNYYSNHIEGNTLTIGETKSLILHSYATAIDKRLKDVQEMKAHIEAYDEVGFLAESVLTDDNKPLEITQNRIRELHGKIFVEDEKRKIGDGWVTIPAGQYKISPNHVKTTTGEIFRYAEPEQVPQMMTDLMDWYNQARLNWNPIVLAGVFHYKFSRIHPFGDANGRMARLLTNLILQSSGYMLAVVKDGQSKNNYLQALEKTDRNFPDIQDSLQSVDIDLFEPFVKEVAHLVLENMELMVRGAEGEDISDSGDILKQFRMEMKTQKEKKQTDRFWLTEEGNIPQLLKESIIPLLQIIEEFCFILAEDNFTSLSTIFGIWNWNKADSTIDTSNDKKYTSLFRGRFTQEQKDLNNWEYLLEWAKKEPERWQIVSIINVNYDFQKNYQKKNSCLKLASNVLFKDYHWEVQVVFDGDIKKKKFRYGEQISEEELKDILRFLVSKSKSLLKIME